MKVLIIDRVKVFQQIIAGVLLDSGIEHSFALNGSEAVKALESDSFQCICVSLYLDDIDGIELCKQIRKIKGYKHTPIVLLTTESDPETFKLAINSGITDIFLKDQIDQLVNFLDRFTQVNQPLQGRVLYIEDQRSQREYVTAMFRGRQLEVDAFDNAEDAWQAFLKNHYHLVLTDIVLEGPTSGILLINKIRRIAGTKGDTPILAVTGFDDPSRRISLFHMGITDYITKPIMEEELTARVRNLISNQLALEKEIHIREQLNSEEMVRHAQKMEALGKLTGGIVHDYNNMLGIVTGYTEVLREKLADQPELLQYLEQVSKAGESATQLTRKLLAFTRMQSEETESVNLTELVNGMKPMLDKTLTSSITLSTLLDDKLWSVSADTHDVENALLNMCINAKHAMPSGGELNIVTTNRELDLPRSEKLGLAPGSYVQLSIRDSGSGIDEETQSRIFEPFFSTKGELGTGLGLSQVYGLTQRCGGTISVKSKPGQGALFNLYFARSQTQPESLPIKQDDESTSTTHQGASILVVDDEIALCQLMELYLLEQGYAVVTVSSAAEALECLKDEPFDILLSDVIMPGENGYQLAEKARKEYPNMKIILSTGYDDDLGGGDERQKLYDCRIQKPINRNMLLKAVASL